MDFHLGKRLFVAAAVVGALAVFAAAFFVTLGIRSVVAGPGASPGGPVPNPGHQWTELQDHGIDGGDYWLGTIDMQALELRVNGSRALRLEPNNNVIGGYSGNAATDGAGGAAIGGGGEPGLPNRVTDQFGTVGGGGDNRAGDDDGDNGTAEYATVGGGGSNTASGGSATVGGGATNTASANQATVGGGQENSASALWATVGGGYINHALEDYATVGGGGGNIAAGFLATVGGGGGNSAGGITATVGGGETNTASANNATVGGGYQNQSSGDSATVAGGHANIAGADYSTVGGGYSNEATVTYATVGGGWNNEATNDDATVSGGVQNSASGLRATVGGGSNNTASSDDATVPGGRLNTAQGGWSFAAGHRAKANDDGAFVWSDSNDFDFPSTAANEFAVRATGGSRIVTGIDGSGIPDAGVKLDPDDNAWEILSDRDAKENFVLLDPQDVLSRLAGIPITEWNYKTQDPSNRHIGPMAQDFYAAFGLSADDLYISPIDTDGVALAAIQGLYELSQEQADRIDALEARVAALEGEAGVSGGSAGSLSSIMPAGWLLFGALFLGGLVLVQRQRAGGRR